MDNSTAHLRDLGSRTSSLCFRRLVSSSAEIGSVAIMRENEDARRCHTLDTYCSLLSSRVSKRLQIYGRQFIGLACQKPLAPEPHLGSDLLFPPGPQVGPSTNPGGSPRLRYRAPHACLGDPLRRVDVLARLGAAGCDRLVGMGERLGRVRGMRDGGGRWEKKMCKSLSQPVPKW